MKILKRVNWQIWLSIILLLLSVFLYFLHFLIFKDAHHIFLYLLGDIAFIPIDVLLVTVIIHQLLTKREKRIKLKKLNMVIGVFFSNAGTELLRALSSFNFSIDSLSENLAIDSQWSEKQFIVAAKRIKKDEYKIDCKKGDLGKLKEFLSVKSDFLLRLLENPNLLEHDAFTELLWAVSHLAEELNYREDPSALSVKDCEHLAGDIKRAYILLIYEWLLYMKHLKFTYPYLFSLAVRINPFKENSVAEIK
jgi:hypothetical protein